MRPVLTAGEMREVDAQAVASGTPVATLIERAGTAVATEAIALLGGTYGRRVVVVAGSGNNGADGRMAASVLARRGVRTLIVDAREAPGKLPSSDLVIDAAYGTGFRGDYEAPDPAGAPVLAVDIPTGVDADSGVTGANAVRAVATVTFGALKPGLLVGEGRSRAGRVFVHRIGLPVPPVAECEICLVVDDDIVAHLPVREFEAHKWQTALAVVAGSPGMYGAPGYVAHGAARAGAGMVRLGIPGAAPSDMGVSEAVSHVLPMNGFDEAALEMLQRCKALVIGPGLGLERPTRASVRRLVTSAPVPVLVDADALTALGGESSTLEVIGPRTEDDPDAARGRVRPPRRVAARAGPHRRCARTGVRNRCRRPFEGVDDDRGGAERSGDAGHSWHEPARDSWDGRRALGGDRRFLGPRDGRARGSRDRGARARPGRRARAARGSRRRGPS